MNRTVRRIAARAEFTAAMTVGRLSASLVRGRRPQVDREVVLETWDAVADGADNSNTDLIFWNDAFYLCHQTSPFHLGTSRSRMLLWRSNDARSWERVAEFKAASGEYRDPTFAAIHGRLFVYLLPNRAR